MEEIANLFHGFSRRPPAVQPHGDARRHHARRHHRRAARPRRRQRRRDPAAADVLHVADLGDHHAVLHLLGGAVRRRHHLGAVQYSGRAMVGSDHLRRPSHGAAGQGRRGADRRLHVVLRGRAVRGDHDHAGCAAGCQIRAAVRAGGEIRRLFPCLLQLRRHEQGAAVQDRGRDDDRLCARGGRPGQRHRPAAADLRLHRTAHRLRLPHRGDRPVRHRRDSADHRGRAELQGRRAPASIRRSCSRPGPSCRATG